MTLNNDFVDNIIEVSKNYMFIDLAIDTVLVLSRSEIPNVILLIKNNKTLEYYYSYSSTENVFDLHTTNKLPLLTIA